MKKDSLIMLGAFASTSVVNYAFGLAMGWVLLPGDFGLLAFVQTILLIAGLLLNSGFAWSLTAQIAREPGERWAGLIRGALVANLLMALLLSAGLLLLYGTGSLRSGLEMGSIALLMALSFPFIAFIAIVRGAARGAEHFGAVAAIQVAEVVGKAIGGLALVLAGLGPEGAVAGFLLGSVGATLVALWLLRRTLGLTLWGALERPALGGVSSMFGALLGMALLLNLDIVALKLFSGGERAVVGEYQAAIILANTPYYLATAMLAVLFPRLARLEHLSLTGARLGEMLRLILLFLIPVEVGLALLPEMALALLFPPAYLAGASALRILAVGNGALLLVAALSTAFQATGRASTAARILLGVTTVEAIALWQLVPLWGAAGAALLFAVATMSALFLLGLFYLRALAPAPLGIGLSWLGRYGLALALGTAVTLIALSQSHHLFVALLLGVPVYLGAVLFFRLLPLPPLALPGRVALTAEEVP